MSVLTEAARLLEQQVREKAQGSTDAPFWRHVADTILALAAEVERLKRDAVPQEPDAYMVNAGALVLRMHKEYSHKAVENLALGVWRAMVAARAGHGE